jgi:hypothetical protein
MIKSIADCICPLNAKMCVHLFNEINKQMKYADDANNKLLLRIHDLEIENKKLKEKLYI